MSRVHQSGHGDGGGWTRDFGPGRPSLNHTGKLPRLKRAIDVAIDQVRDQVDNRKADEKNREVHPRRAGKEPESAMPTPQWQRYIG